MEVKKEDLEKRRLELTRQVEALMLQLGQAQQATSQLPLRIAALQGEMAGLEWTLSGIGKPPKK